MIIKADGLTRKFGDITAVDHISFEVGAGEIVGLLGPNGAGKTTTMRMLTCFIPATEGTATVAGSDIFKDPVAVRRNIGYMPENNPLYPEMRVKEYLAFRAKLKGVPRNDRQKRIDRAVDRCSLLDVRKQVIHTLSKGYRQRVGLADAMLGDPKILILDEPTIGLDPNQIRQTRQTIQEIGRTNTILLSTHILQEVEAICQRILIIHKGAIVADDTPGNLSKKAHGNVVEVEIKVRPDEARKQLALIRDVKEVEILNANGWTRLAVFPKNSDVDLREPIFNCVKEKGWTLREMVSRRTSLEEIFYMITAGKDVAI